MRNPVTFIILALFLASCANEPAVVEPTLPTDDEAKAAIMEKIQFAAEKWASGDPMGYVDCAAPDITWMDDLMAPTPIIGREALETYLGNFKGQIPPHKSELLNWTFQFYGDMVIITYHYQGMTPEGPLGNPWKISSVYRYADGDWFSVHENWTNVKSEE